MNEHAKSGLAYKSLCPGSQHHARARVVHSVSDAILVWVIEKMGFKMINERHLNVHTGIRFLANKYD